MTEFLTCRPNLEVRDLVPTVRFLSDVLEFDVDVADDQMGLAIMHRDAVSVAIVRTANPAVNETSAAYLTVTEVDDLHERCVRHGATVVIPPTDRPWGLRDFVVEIPGGHRLALGQALE